MVIFLPRHHSSLKSSNRAHWVSETLLWLDTPHSVPISVYWSSVPCQWYTDQTSLPNHPISVSWTPQKYEAMVRVYGWRTKREMAEEIQNPWEVVHGFTWTQWKVRLWLLAGQERLRKVKKCLGFSTSTHPVRMSIQRMGHNSAVGCLPPSRAHEAWAQFPSTERKHTTETLEELSWKHSQQTPDWVSSPCPWTPEYHFKEPTRRKLSCWQLRV